MANILCKKEYLETASAPNIGKINLTKVIKIFVRIMPSLVFGVL